MAERKGSSRASEPGPLKAPMLANWLATLYAPLQPHLKNLIQIERAGARDYDPRDILLPEGYLAEVVATELNAPVHCCFDDAGNCYVVESGHKIDVPPRILKVNPASGQVETFFTLPEARWYKPGAVTGACWHEGYLYVMNTDSLFRLDAAGQNLEEIVTDLPGIGDHQANYPVVGPDGKLYFAVGTATNSGVVGEDDYAFEWLPKHPDFHDLPGADITLVGTNWEMRDVLGDVTETVVTGAYSPFGTPTEPGQVVRGQVKCTGSILRCDPDGSNLELVAWGLRNPYGIAFHPEGRLFAVEHGMDERSHRYIVDDPDDFYEIHEGAWYGWPDFASGIRLDDPYWGDGGRGREPVLAEHPDPNPPKPLVTFQDARRGQRGGFLPRRRLWLCRRRLCGPLWRPGADHDPEASAGAGRLQGRARGYGARRGGRFRRQQVSWARHRSCRMMVSSGPRTASSGRTAPSTWSITASSASRRKWGASACSRARARLWRIRRTAGPARRAAAGAGGAATPRRALSGAGGRDGGCHRRWRLARRGGCAAK
jgi:sugar lactone lactonase YvrE